MQVEAVIAKLDVEAFDECILRGLAGLDKVQFYANESREQVGPGMQRSDTTRELDGT